MAIRAFQIGFAASEMLLKLKLNLEAPKPLSHENLANIDALAGAGDIANLSEWTGQFRAGADRVSGYGGNVCEIGGQASSQLGDLLEQTLLSINQEVLEWVEEVLKSSSIPQSQAIASDAKAAMANAKTGFDGISKAVRRTAGYADASVRVATAATAEAVNSTAK